MMLASSTKLRREKEDQKTQEERNNKVKRK
jgi:hypothetical protein